MPGTVFVGAERHRVQIYRTADGLMGKCACPGGCGAIPDAVRAVQIMVEAWERTPRTRVYAGIELDSRLDPVAEEQRARRPYDGLARAMCEADLVPMNVPRCPASCPQEVTARIEADRDQSTDAFHLAMYVGAALLVAGALVNAVGISNEAALEATRRRTPMTTI